MLVRREWRQIRDSDLDSHELLEIFVTVQLNLAIGITPIVAGNQHQ
jgi:hypothetical protein